MEQFKVCIPQHSADCYCYSFYLVVTYRSIYTLMCDSSRINVYIALSWSKSTWCCNQCAQNGKETCVSQTVCSERRVKLLNLRVCACVCVNAFEISWRHQGWNMRYHYVPLHCWHCSKLCSTRSEAPTEQILKTVLTEQRFLPARSHFLQHFAAYVATEGASII